MASLVVGSGGEKIFRLEQDTVSIGRDSSNTLQLDDDKVSREHCRIDKMSALLKPSPRTYRKDERELQEKFWIQDLGSSNGTIVNGTLIERKELEDGDEIKLGNTRILFTLKEPREIKDSVVQPAAITGTTLFEGQIEEMDRESLMRDHQNRRTLYKVNSIIRSVFDVDELLEKILDVVLEVIKGERGFIMIKDEKTGELIPKAVRNRDFEQITISKTIVNKVFETGESILTQDAMSDERFASGKSIVDYQIRSCLCAPLKSKDKILGIIHVDNKVSTRS
ncbi:FHA domain-containing protein, partial [bacterium]|nr:FHA domain-containing protein [bacterium]